MSVNVSEVDTSAVGRTSSGIFAAMVAITAEIGGIAKSRKNTGQGYMFRGVADITLACQPLLFKHGVVMVPHRVVEDSAIERATKNGGTQIHVRTRVQWRFYHTDGSYLVCETTGEAMDSGDKASNKAMTASQKYAITQSFCIPEEDPDLDTENSSPEAGPVTLRAAIREALDAPLPPPTEQIAAVKAVFPGAKVAMATPGDVQDVKDAYGAVKDKIGKPAMEWLSSVLGRKVEKAQTLTVEECGVAIRAAKALA